jgi:MASE1
MFSVEPLLNREPAAWITARPEGRSAGVSLRTVSCVLASTLSYYVATQIAWALTFPDSKVSLFFPPQAVLLCILLLVPTRHWWAYVLAAVSAHFLATQQAQWPPLYALNCEAFDAVKCVSAAAGIRILIKSPLKAITLRDAILSSSRQTPESPLPPTRAGSGSRQCDSARHVHAGYVWRRSAAGHACPRRRKPSFAAHLDVLCG